MKTHRDISTGFPSAFRNWLKAYFIAFIALLCAHQTALAASPPTISPVSGAYSSQPNNGNQSVTVGGTVTANNVLTITVFDAGLTAAYEAVPYTVLSGDTLTTIATHITSAINADTKLSAIHVTATSSGAVVTISSTSSNTTTYTGSVSSGATETLTLPIAVTITGDAGASFYYTTDGTTPTTGSTLYAGPFNITTTTTVKAIEVLSGVSSSVTTSFIQIDPTTAALSRKNLQLWLKSDNGVTSTSGSVSAWNDISGNNNNATQATSADQPTLTSGAVNGLPALTFNGTSDYMAVPSGFANFTAGQTIFIVSKPTSSGGVYVDFSNGTNNNGRFDLWQPSGQAQLEAWNSTGGDSQLNGNNAVGNFQVLTTTHDGVSVGTMYTNSAQDAQNTQLNAFPNATRSTNLIGRYSLGSGYFFTGQIAEIFIYNTLLNTQQINAVRTYLYRRYALPLTPPSISPNGTISSSTSQTVTITTDPGNSIYYTTNGTTPTTSSTPYTGSFTVTSATNVQAIAAYGSNVSSVSSAYFSFDSATATLPRTGLTCWYRTDNGLLTNNAQGVTAWYDSSGNGFNSAPPTTSNEPTVNLNATNGHTSVLFNGSTSSLELNAGTANFTGGLTAFVVAKPYADNGVFFDFSNGASQGRFDFWAPSLTQTEFEVYGATGGDSSVVGTNSIQYGPYQLFEVAHNGVSTATLYNNAAQVGQNAGGMNGIANVNRSTSFIGQYSLGNGYYFNGEISEILLYNTVLTSAQVTAVQEYLATRYAPTVTPSTGVSSTSTVNMTSYSGDPVHYTLDGSTPTSSSTLFQNPFSLTQSTIVKAITSTSLGTSLLATSYIDVDPTAQAIPRSNLSLWLRPNFGLITSGTNLTNWIDLSGSGMNASQSTTAKQPQVVQDQVSNFSAVQFNGTSSYLQMPSGFPTFDTGATGFVVTKPTAFSNYSRLFDLSNGASGNGLRFYLASTAGSGLTTQTGTGTTNLIATTGAANGQYQLLEFTHNGAGSAALLTNGSSIGTSSSMDNIDQITRADNFIGADYTGANLLSGQIVEMLLYNTALSSPNQNAVESYLMQKYGLLTLTPAAPIFSVAAGTLSGPTAVAIAEPAGATVYVTTDGSMPTSASPLYTGPIQVNYSQTLKAIAIKNGVSSAVSTAAYVLNSTQYPSPSNGDTTTPMINLQVPVPAK